MSWNEPFWVTYFELGLASGSEINWLKLCKLLKLLKPSLYYIISSPVEPARKLNGLAEIWALVVSGIGLINCELFFRPGLSSLVEYPFQL